MAPWKSMHRLRLDSFPRTSPVNCFATEGAKFPHNPRVEESQMESQIAKNMRRFRENGGHSQEEFVARQAYRFGVRPVSQPNSMALKTARVRSRTPSLLKT